MTDIGLPPRDVYFVTFSTFTDLDLYEVQILG